MDYKKARKKTKENESRKIEPPVRVDYAQRRRMLILIILAVIAIVLGVVISQY